MFPAGSSGLGILLLRGAIGVTAVVHGWAYFVGHDESAPWMWMAGVIAIIDGAAVIIGLVTRLASVILALGAVGTTVRWLPAPTANLFEAALPAAFVIVVAVAIVFLGPGALSMDAHLFGFREIIITRKLQFPDSK